MAKAAGFAKTKRITAVPGQKHGGMNGPTGKSSSHSAGNAPGSPSSKPTGSGQKTKKLGSSSLPKASPMPHGLGSKRFLPKNW